MLQPCVRKRGQIGIVCENLMWSLKLLKLDQKTAFADEAPKGVEGLHLVQLGGLQVGIGKGRHTQINEDLLQGEITETATNGRAQSSHD